jgi:hypothetical protein
LSRNSKRRIQERYKLQEQIEAEPLDLRSQALPGNEGKKGINYKSKSRQSLWICIPRLCLGMRGRGEAKRTEVLTTN